jgi:hypothetical protein
MAGTVCPIDASRLPYRLEKWTFLDIAERVADDRLGIRTSLDA